MVARYMCFHFIHLSRKQYITVVTIGNWSVKQNNNSSMYYVIPYMRTQHSVEQMYTTITTVRWCYTNNSFNVYFILVTYFLY